MFAASVEGEALMLQELFERWFYDIDYYQREFAWWMVSTASRILSTTAAFSASSTS